MNYLYKKGFTIIELLVVIVIIGILSTIVFTGLGIFQKKSKDALIKTELMQFYTMYTQYITQGGDLSLFCDNVVRNSQEYTMLPAYNSYKNAICGSQTSDWFVCAVLNDPADQSQAWCIDDTGAESIIWADACRTPPGGIYTCATLPNPFNPFPL